jgi:hypothetical protein
MCMADDEVMSMPSLVAVTHNYFHSTEPAENDANGQSDQGGFYGLIPYRVRDDLEGIEATPTGKAFLSTMDPSNWKQRDDHYCCQMYGVGSRAANPSPIPSVTDTHQMMGSIDAISVVNGQNTISGWACVHGVDEPISVDLYVGGPAADGQLVGRYPTNTGSSESAVAQTCGATRSALPVSNSADDRCLICLWGQTRLHLRSFKRGA